MSISLSICEESKMYSAQQTIMSCITRRYIKSHVLRGEDNVPSIKATNSEMPNAQENSIRPRTLSESFGAELDWIVFEDDGLYETCNKGTTLSYPIETRYISNSTMRKNDNPCKDSSSSLDAKTTSFRMRSLSESSTNSEDSNYSSIDEQETTECPRMRCLTKINNEHHKDYNSQKNVFQHRQLQSHSFENSDDFITTRNSDDLNSSFVTEESNDVDGCVETSFHDGDNQLDDSIIFADENNEEVIAQTKKVSFDPTPVVHVMVTWDYAYRAARRGPWEEMARDNERFKGRIKSIAIVLDPILKSKHRSQVWQERFAFPEYS